MRSPAGAGVLHSAGLRGKEVGLLTLARRGGVLFALAVLVSGCAHRGGVAPVAASVTAPADRASEDPTTRLTREADAELAAGVADLEQGHLNKARESFDRVVDAYLGAPGGAYANPRLAEAYRRTLEQIHLLELTALAAGHGIAERLPDPASIDAVGDIPVLEEPASEEVRRTAEAAVLGEANDLPIDLNDAVLSCIDLYQGPLRDWFSEALGRGSRYLPFIRAAFAAEGIPQDLAYVALVESAFKPTALSRARARGVWQFISATGKRYGLEQDWWLDERGDPEKATRAAARYLKELYEMFGDWNLAMAGYNAGEGKVTRALARYGTRDFWELRNTRAFKRETQNYVPMIHAAIVVAKAPDQYGFEVAPETQPAVEAVPIEGATDLRLLAECARTPLADLQQLNPELRRLATPAGRTFHLKVPLGSGPELLDCVAAIPPQKRVTFKTHVVTRGQTFSGIAQRYGTSTRTIAEANGMSLGKRLSIGMVLIVPVEPRVKPAPPRAASLAKAPTALDPAPGAVRISYTIKPGDTLIGIAEQYRTTVRELQSWNGLRGSRIAAGHTLTIYKSH